MKKALLFYASSESSADVLYLSKMFIPDPFLSMVVGQMLTYLEKQKEV